MFVEGLNIPPGEVVWSRDDLAGIEVFEELSWTSIIPWVREITRNAQRPKLSGQPALTKLSSTFLRPACSKSISSLLPSIAAMVP